VFTEADRGKKFLPIMLGDYHDLMTSTSTFVAANPPPPPQQQPTPITTSTTTNPPRGKPKQPTLTARMMTVEQQLQELTAKVDKLFMGVDLANNDVSTLTKTIS
jgi:hypothetical protein